VNERTIHKDWPPVDLTETSHWCHGAPTSDLAEALAYETLTAEPVPVTTRHIDLTDVATVERYAISYHDDEWKPGESAGTELDMVVVGTTITGEWFAVEAWNDYTGWGCQEGSNVRLGATEEHVVAHGLTVEGRAKLGYPEATP